MRSILLAWALIVVTVMFSSCKSNPQKGLLWEISGNGLTEKSYLFGTWHGAAGVCIDILDSIPNFYTKFDSVTQYVGENVGGEEYSETMASVREYLGEQWMPQDTKYSDLLNEADILFLDSLLQKYIGATSSEVNIRPNHLLFVLSSVLGQRSYFEEENEKCKIVMDRYLEQEAKEKNCSLAGLDSPETTKRLLMEIFLGDYKLEAALEEQASALVDQIREMLSQDDNRDLKICMQKMKDAYRRMDLKDLVDSKNESIEIAKKTVPKSFDFDEFYRFILIGRNKLWIEKIPVLIAEKSTFIAVGALHLCGEEGLICLLREKGYTVKLVK